MTTVDYNGQKKDENQSTVLDNININNRISDMNIISEENKNKSSIKSLIFVGIAISLIIISAIVLVIVLSNKKEKKHYNVRYNYNDTGVISNDTNKGNETSNTDETESEKENILIDYDSAEKLIDSEIIKENHNLLNESLNNINGLILMNNNITFSKIQTEVGDNPKNLDFLLSSNESSVKVAKDDIDLYKSRYISLSKETNNYTNELSNALNNISTSLNEFKNEIDNITKQYEEMIKNLSIPFYLNSNQTNQKLRNLIDDELLDKYKQEIEKLNNFSKSYFECIHKTVRNINSTTYKVKDNADALIDKVNIGISKFNEKLKNITEETLHPELIEIKDSFISFKDYMDNSKVAFDNIKTEIIQSLEEKVKLDLEQQNFTEILININEKIAGFEKKARVIKLNKLSNNIISSFEFNYQIISPVKIIYYLLVREIEEEVDRMIKIANVEIGTSLDLLFIMDCTGSMSTYIEDAKKNILSIINRIIIECPGIDINLGFIGYRDYYERYTDIDFTQNHAYVKNIINNIYASGGGDLPEDVAFALELALNKTWKSNARMAVFVADAPGHGNNYSDYDNVLTNVPERLLIEDSIAEMAEKKIALFCYRISAITDKMFKLFQDIYKNKKYNNTKFQIVNKTNSLSDVVINYSVEIYNGQRKTNSYFLPPDNYTTFEKLKIYLESIIPQKASNDKLLSLIKEIKTPTSIFLSIYNLYKNIKNFENHRETIKKNGGYIEDQHNYEDMYYGIKTIAYSGCEIIATYNAIYFLTKDENISFPKMIEDFEIDGICLFGVFGTDPLSIEKYLKKKGYNTTSSYNKEEYDNIGKKYDVFIMTFYNNKYNIFDMIHTTAITKEKGYYYIHNNGDSSKKYKSISELLEKIDDGLARDIFLIGIKK